MTALRPFAACLTAGLAVCLVLAGCGDGAADQGAGPVMAPDGNGLRQASAPAPLHDWLAGQGQRLQVRLDTLENHPVALNRWFSLRADCSLEDYFRVALVFAPSHGRVEIAPGRFRPNSPVDTYRHACDAAPRDGIGATYRPADGFTGTDDMTLRITAPSGKSWTTDFVVVVRHVAGSPQAADRAG